MYPGYDCIDASRAPVVEADFYPRKCRPLFNAGQDRLKIPHRISSEFRQDSISIPPPPFDY